MTYIFKMLKYLLITIFLIFASCQNDDFQNQHNHTNESLITEKRITIKDLQRKSAAFDKFSSFIGNNQDMLQQRMVHSDVYGFNVNTDEILMIEKGSYHSFTFSIYRDQASEVVENLVLSLKPDGSYKAGIMKYDFNGEKTVSGVFYNYLGNDVNVEYVPIDIDAFGDELFERGELECNQVSTLVVQECSQGIHNSTNMGSWSECEAEVKPQVYFIVETQCQEIGGGTPGSGDPGGIGGGDTGGGEGTPGTGTPDDPDDPSDPQEPEDDFGDAPVITKPVGPLIPADTNCNDLKAKSEDEDFKAKMTILNNDANNPVESGYVTYHSGEKYSEKQLGGIDEYGRY